MLKKISYTNEFKRDFKRVAKSGRYKLQDFEDVLMFLRSDAEIPKKYRDHALVGDWQGYRECHIKPDWLLIYQTTEDIVVLVRTGSHSSLFS